MESESSGHRSGGDREKAAIRETIGRFSEGIRSLDAKLVASVFHPRAASFTFTARGICIEPYESWPRVLGEAIADRRHLFREQFTTDILLIDVAGAAATAKVAWTFESARIVDYYNLLKTDGQWLIVGQVYHTFARQDRS